MTVETKVEVAKDETKEDNGKQVNRRTVDFIVPEGGLRTATPEGYNHAIHAKLKPGDFYDALDYQLWLAGWHDANAADARAKAEQLRTLGGDAEERSAVLAYMAAMEKAQKELEKLSAVNAKLRERCAGIAGNMFASMKAS